MRTTINIRDDLFEDLEKMTGEKSKTAAVNHALEDWLRLKKIQELRSMRGKLSMAEDWRELRNLEKEEEL